MPANSSPHIAALLAVAAAAIDHGLSERRAMPVIPQDYPELLQQPGASFVTLRIGHRLRGCMGSLRRPSRSSSTWPATPSRPLSRSAICPLGPRRIRRPVDSSVASGKPEPLTFASEAELLSLIRPGIDGLTLSEGTTRATLLPAVWKTVSDRGNSWCT